MIPGLGRSTGEGKGCPLHYSGLEDSKDCIVHGVAKSQTRLSNFHSLTHPFLSPSLSSGPSRYFSLNLYSPSPSPGIDISPGSSGSFRGGWYEVKVWAQRTLIVNEMSLVSDSLSEKTLACIYTDIYTCVRIYAFLSIYVCICICFYLHV